MGGLIGNATATKGGLLSSDLYNKKVRIDSQVGSVPGAKCFKISSGTGQSAAGIFFSISRIEGSLPALYYINTSSRYYSYFVPSVKVISNNTFPRLKFYYVSKESITDVYVVVDSTYYIMRAETMLAHNTETNVTEATLPDNAVEIDVYDTSALATDVGGLIGNLRYFSPSGQGWIRLYKLDDGYSGLLNISKSWNYGQPLSSIVYYSVGAHTEIRHIAGYADSLSINKLRIVTTTDGTYIDAYYPTNNISNLYFHCSTYTNDRPEFIGQYVLEEPTSVVVEKSLDNAIQSLATEVGELLTPATIKKYGPVNHDRYISITGLGFIIINISFYAEHLIPHVVMVSSNSYNKSMNTIIQGDSNTQVTLLEDGRVKVATAQWADIVFLRCGVNISITDS